MIWHNDITLIWFSCLRSMQLSFFSTKSMCSFFGERHIWGYVSNAGFFFTDFCASPTNGFAGFLSLGGKSLSLETISWVYDEKCDVLLENLLFLLENYKNLPDFWV